MSQNGAEQANRGATTHGSGREAGYRERFANCEAPLLFVALRDLQWRRRRFGIAVVATSLVFGIALLITGISATFDNEIDRTLEAIGADAWLVPEGDTAPFTGSVAVPARLAGPAEELEGVEEADPIVLGTASILEDGGNRPVTIIGVVPGGVGYPDGIEGEEGPLDAARSVVPTSSLGFDVGDSLSVSGLRFRVTGEVHGISFFAGTPTLVMRLEDAQLLRFAGRPLANAIITHGVPESVPDEVGVLTNDDARADLLGGLTKAKATIDFMRILMWVLAAAIIGAIVYLAALERTRDFAVMKATGVSTRSLLGGLLLQAVLLALVAAGLAVGVEMLIAPASALPAEVPASAFYELPVVAVVLGMVASLAAVRRAVKVDPALALVGA